MIVNCNDLTRSINFASAKVSSHPSRGPFFVCRSNCIWRWSELLAAIDIAIEEFPPEPCHLECARRVDKSSRSTCELQLPSMCRNSLTSIPSRSSLTKRKRCGWGNRLFTWQTDSVEVSCSHLFCRLFFLALDFGTLSSSNPVLLSF